MNQTEIKRLKEVYSENTKKGDFCLAGKTFRLCVNSKSLLNKFGRYCYYTVLVIETLSEDNTWKRCFSTDITATREKISGGIKNWDCLFSNPSILLESSNKDVFFGLVIGKTLKICKFNLKNAYFNVSF